MTSYYEWAAQLNQAPAEKPLQPIPAPDDAMVTGIREALRDRQVQQ